MREVLILAEVVAMCRKVFSVRSIIISCSRALSWPVFGNTSMNAPPGSAMTPT